MTPEVASPSTLELLATILFGVAIVHTFATGVFQRIGNRFAEGTVGENLFHLLGEVEVVFGFWAGTLIVILALLYGPGNAADYAENLNFTEPLFVFSIMTISATRPILSLAVTLILKVSTGISALTRVDPKLTTYACCLVLGPLLGSLITEPAAMTLTAIILGRRYFGPERTLRLKYVTLATLFVNVSIGGVLTPYAAPPVLMVAKTWGWDLAFMIGHFGWKSALAVAINSVGATLLLRRELKAAADAAKSVGSAVPVFLSAIHLVFLALVVISTHHPVIFIGALLFFLGMVAITREYQDELRLREALLVAFFLGGLVVLGGPQRWWLEPLISNLSALPLFLGATGLTAITDNAALTYLGSQIQGISPEFQYALVAGAIAGGGLTVIANAPNPAGYSILREGFGKDGIRPELLFAAALVPTWVAMACLWLL
jgi:hypothetical protein